MLSPSEQVVRAGLRAVTAEEPGTGQTRTYLADGQCLCWTPPTATAPLLVIDAELAAPPVPPALARRFGATAFWERWTRAECMAKVAGEPIVVRLRSHGLRTEPAAAVRTLRIRLGGESVVVSAAYAAGQDSRFSHATAASVSSSAAERPWSP